MKTHFSFPLFAASSAVLFILVLAGCEPSPQMSPGDDIKNYVDFAPASKRLMGAESTRVQRELGSPNGVVRQDETAVDWFYHRRFCEADARWIYKDMVLHFEDRKLVSMHPPKER